MGDIEPQKDLPDTAEEEDRLFNEEWQKWAVSKLPHPRECFVPDLFLLTQRFDALIQFLEDEGVLDRDKFLAYLLKNMREEMERMRPEVTKMVQAGQIAQIQRKILGPNGQPFN